MHSPEEDAAPTHALLLQVHSILLSTLSNISRGQLTVGDAVCALRLTLSPITYNIVWWCVGSLYRKLRRRESHTRRTPFVIGFSILLIPGWIVLFHVITLSRTAFKDSNEYDHDGYTYIVQLIMFIPISSPLFLDPTYAGWVMFWPALLQWLLLVIWTLYTVRHARDILEWKAKNEKPTSSWKRLKLMFKSIWHVIDTAHPWIGGFSVVSVLTTWAAPLILVLLDSQHGYVFSYGQTIAVFLVIPHIWSLCGLCCQKWGAFLSMWRSLPCKFYDGIIFLVTGQRNPWDKHKYSRDLGSGPTTSVIPDLIPLRTDSDHLIPLYKGGFPLQFTPHIH